MQASVTLSFHMRIRAKTLTWLSLPMLAVVLLAGCSGFVGSRTQSPADGPPPAESRTGDGIAWNEAIDYAGTVQRVCGPLAGTGNSEDDIFLDLGRDYPDPERFQLVIWDIGSIDPIPLGATVCASGQISLYGGVGEIELDSASAVEIYG